jgi:hypothetical protein
VPCACLPLPFPPPSSVEGVLTVAALTQYSLSLNRPAAGGGDPTVQLSFAGALVAVPPGPGAERGLALSGLRTLDLPVVGRVAVTGADVAEGRVGAMPYLGEIERAGDLDSSNVVMLETDGGLFVRGAVSCGLGLGLGLAWDWDWPGTGDWDWGLGLGTGTGAWDWGLGLGPGRKEGQPAAPARSSPGSFVLC